MNTLKSVISRTSPIMVYKIKTIVKFQVQFTFGHFKILGIVNVRIIL